MTVGQTLPCRVQSIVGDKRSGKGGRDLWQRERPHGHPRGTAVFECPNSYLDGDPFAHD